MQIINNNPEVTSAHYYLGRIAQNRGQERAAIDSFSKVRFSDHEYLLAQAELSRLGAIKMPRSSEIEQAFESFREHFILAQELDRMYFLLALTSASFGDTDKTKAYLQKINRRNEGVLRMRNNFSEVASNLSNDRALRGILPEIVYDKDGVPVKVKGRGGLFWPLLLFGIVLTVIITYFLTVSLTSTKRVKTKQLAGDVGDFDLEDDTLHHIKPNEGEKEAGGADIDTEQQLESSQNLSINKISVTTIEPSLEEINEELEPILGESFSIESSGQGVVLDEDDEEEDTIQPEGIQCSDLKRKLAYRLYVDGWNIAAIAKELDSPEIEIDKIINEMEKTQTELD